MLKNTLSSFQDLVIRKAFTSQMISQKSEAIQSRSKLVRSNQITILIHWASSLSMKREAQYFLGESYFIFQGSGNISEELELKPSSIASALS